MRTKTLQPTPSITQDEICEVFQKDLENLQRPYGIIAVEGVLLFGEEFGRGALMCFQPKDTMAEGTDIEWTDLPVPLPTLHQAIMVMAERTDDDLKELRVMMGGRVLWVHEGDNVVLSVLTKSGSEAHKGIWRSLRRLAEKTSTKIQRLTVEDALIHNVKIGHMVCSHDADGNDQFQITPKGIKHVESM